MELRSHEVQRSSNSIGSEAAQKLETARPETLAAWLLKLDAQIDKMRGAIDRFKKEFVINDPGNHLLQQTVIELESDLQFQIQLRTVIERSLAEKSQASYDADLETN